MQDTEFYNALASYLAVKDARLELAPGLEVIVKQMSLRDRLAWRAGILDEKGAVRDNWELELLALTVRKLDGSRVWSDAGAVDGSEEAIRPILEKALQVNGLAQGQVKSDEGN